MTALAQLNQTPADKVAQIMGDLVLQNAAGMRCCRRARLTTPFTDTFLQEMNTRLKQAGKPGTLTMATDRYPGVCGLVLKTSQSEMYCV